MAENRGIAPPDLTTPVGKFRALFGDVEYEEFDPPETGYGKYQKFSDVEIQGFLEVADDSPEGAMYFAYMQLAGSAAIDSKSVKDLDLQVDLTKRSTDLRAIAQIWKDQWDSSTGDIFEVFDIGEPPLSRPELSAWSVGGFNGNRLF